MTETSVYHRGLLAIPAGTQLFLKCCGEPCEALKAEQEDQTNRTAPHLGLLFRCRTSVTEAEQFYPLVFSFEGEENTPKNKTSTSKCSVERLDYPKTACTDWNLLPGKLRQGSECPASQACTGHFLHLA